MHIAVIAGRDPFVRDDTDGGSVFLEYVMRTFSGLGIRTDIFLPLGVAGSRYVPERAKEQTKISEGTRDDLVSLQYVSVGAGAGNPSVDYFQGRIERSRLLAEALQGVDFSTYDAICVLHVANAFFLTTHNLLPMDRTVLFPMMTSAHYDLFAKVPSEYITLESDTLRKFKHICSPSDDEISKLIERFSLDPSSLFKVHRGFDENDFPVLTRTVKKPGVPLNLICANGIRPQKDHLFLISVVKELTRNGTKTVMHLTGNNGRSHNPSYNLYTERFWDTVSSEGLENSFVCHDIVSRSALASLMAGSDMAVYASKSETFGKSALESVVSGLPTIVCDDVPAFREFIQNGITGVIAPRSPGAFAQSILDTISQPSLYETIRANGIALRPDFTWEKVIHDLLQALKRRGIGESGILR